MTRVRGVAEAVLRAGVAAVDPRRLTARALRPERGVLRVAETEEVVVPEAGRVWAVGAGKAAAGMALGLLDVLGDRVAGGALTVPHGVAAPVRGLVVWEARHPVPDAHGLAGAAEALRVARSAGADDLLLCVLSGGASALWPAPPEGVTLGDLQAVTRALLRSGAPIEDVNTVRRHLSRIAGGNLARATRARVVTLALSDVPGGGAHEIGSGPTAPDPTTYGDALAVLARWEVPAPTAVRRHLQAGLAGERAETVKPGELDPGASFHVLASVRDALAAAAEEAVRLGYPSVVMSDRLTGEARSAGEEIARAALRARNAGEGPRALLWGGETTVTVHGDGRGGRNQELALAAAHLLDGETGVVIAALATDGIDGPTGAAGAVVDGATLQRARAAGLDPLDSLRRNDSHPALRATGDLIVTGPTGTNVNDLVLALIG